MRAAFLRNLIADTRGATALEYALLAMLLSIAIISVLVNIGAGVTDLYGDVQSEVEAVDS